jgi:phosphatidate cytidylyltransferase
MTRVLSAAALVAVLVLAVWFGPAWATLALGVLASALAGSELMAMAGSGMKSLVPLAALTSGVLTGAFAIGEWAFRWGPLVGPSVPMFSAVILAAALLVWGMALSTGVRASDALSTKVILFMAPVYVGLPLGMLVWVRLVHGGEALLLPIVIVAASDTAQYYTGRAIGRRKLAPRISPSKTIEGAVGGLVAAAIVATFLAPRWLGPADTATGLASPLVGAAVGVTLALAGMAGDLFESFLKRRAGVKDSSSVIPGHGGVLDRVDSHLFAAPLYYLMLRYLR